MLFNIVRGKIIFSGVGKSGLICKKISATFSSVGIPSFFCDPTQASHGDMGQIQKKRFAYNFFKLWKYFGANKYVKICKQIWY